MDRAMDPWYSLSWFEPATFSGYTWENPFFLYGLFLLPLLFVVRWLIRFVSHRSFDVFAWYRIGFGLLLLVLLASGQQWMR